MNNKTECLKTQLFFEWIDDLELKTKLTEKVITAKENRFETQKKISIMISVSLTKIKEIEKGTCKDFNAINKYLNYLNETFYY